MGQKTHPKGFRLVTTQKHLSTWYSSKNDYSKLINEDFTVRKETLIKFNDFLTLSEIKIDRTPQEGKDKEYVKILIRSLYPRAKETFRKLSAYSEIFKTKDNENPLSDFKKAKGNLKKYTMLILKRKSRSLLRHLHAITKKLYFIKFEFIKNQFEDAVLIAKFIGKQLEKRIPFRRAVKQTIKKVKASLMKGVKIELSGRLNGIEIARSEWKREGKIPLHTLRAAIDYTHQEAQTIYGTIGIKIWLLKK